MSRDQRVSAEIPPISMHSISGMLLLKFDVAARDFGIQRRRPGVLRTYYRSLKFLGRTIRGSVGRFPRECPLCGYRGKFLGYGYPYVCDVYCPSCGSLERHRLLCLAIEQHRFFHDKDVLHFAPETAVKKLVLAQSPRSYVTADLYAKGVHRRENIEQLTIPDRSFDVVVCLHVLEHVNDRAAVPELFRVLRPSGLLIAMFPIVEGWDETFEDASKTSPEERLLYFGQHDHVRFFGRDARARLAAPGFVVEEHTGVEPDVSRYGLARGEKVFLCWRKRAEHDRIAATPELVSVPANAEVA